MKKVKITVLRTMFNEDLAAEYGAEGLAACPFHRKGQVFYADYAKPEGLCDEAWKEREMKCSITETGSESRVLPYAAAMTGCAR